MTRTKAKDLLTRLQDAAVEDLMRTSDEELLSEAREDGDDLESLVSDFSARMSMKLGSRELPPPPPEQDEVSTSRAAGPSRNEVTPQQKREMASQALLKLEHSCRSRYFAYRNIDFKSVCGAIGPDARLVLAENLLSLYINESEGVDDLFPGSKTQMVRSLLRDAIYDPQISPFVGMAMGTLVSTLCTLALGKASGFELDRTQTPAQRSRILRQIRATKEWRAFRNIIAHQPDFVADSVDPSHAVSALASLQAALAHYRPDVIVAVGGGGEIIARFLSAQIKMDVKSYFVASRKHGDYVLDRDLLSAGALKRLVVIDDIARTGRTLASIYNQTFGGLRSVEIKTLALVCSGSAASCLRDSFLVLPLIAHSASVSVPWDNKGSYRATRTNYVFGADRQAAPLKVPKEFYNRIYEDISS